MASNLCANHRAEWTWANSGIEMRSLNSFCAAGPDFTFMNEDNARPHRTQLIDDFLEGDDIRCMDRSIRWSGPQSIEHVWDAVGRVNEIISTSSQ